MLSAVKAFAVAVLLLGGIVNVVDALPFHPSGGATVSGLTITGIKLDGATSTGAFNSNVSNALVGATQAGAITVQTSGIPFSGTLTLGTGSGCPGTNNANFQIVSSSTLETNGAPNPSDITGSTYAICLVATQAGATGSPFSRAFAITGVQDAGISAALYANPYYTCSANLYVSTAGNDSTGNGTIGTPWATLQKANNSTPGAGTCVNVVASGTPYTGVDITHGGSSATPTGYVVYRCTTLGGCTVNAHPPSCAHAACNGEFWWDFGGAGSGGMANYVMIDGFVITGTGAQNDQCLGLWDGNDTGSGFPPTSAHHAWVINNSVSGCGQSGVQFNDGEFFYVVHNTITNATTKSACDGGAQGSGISLAALKPFNGTNSNPNYTRVADDKSNTVLGNLAYNATWFNVVVAWNLLYNNYMPSDSGCGATDGNNFIEDTWNNIGNSWGDYPNFALVAFNVAYNAGGGGVHVFQSGNTVVSNNSIYNNYLDTNISGTSRASLNAVGWGSNFLLNNLVVSIPGSSPLNNNNAIEADPGAGTADIFTHNITNLIGTGAKQDIVMYNNDSGQYSGSTNQRNTSPSWVNVGNSSAGSESTPPNGVNFALSGGSPAISYGTTETYLSSQAADAGACSNLLASCP